MARLFVALLLGLFGCLHRFSFAQTPPYTGKSTPNVGDTATPKQNPAKPDASTRTKTSPISPPSISTQTPVLPLVASQRHDELTLLYHTDLGGRWRSFFCPKKKDETQEETPPDMANLLGLIQSIRQEHAKQGLLKPLLFSTGDSFAPDRSARYILHLGAQTGAAFLAKYLALMEYDVLGIGAADFGTELRQIKLMLEAARAAGVRFSLANVKKIPSEHPLDALKEQPTQVAASTFVIQRGPWRIGVFHLSPESMPEGAQEPSARKITLVAPDEFAKERVKELREKHKADIVVVLSDLEVGDSNGSHARKLASEVEGIDVIVASRMSKGKATGMITHYAENGAVTWIVGGRPHGAQLGQLRWSLRRKDGKVQIDRVDHRFFAAEEKHTHARLRAELLRWEKTYCQNWGAPLGNGRIQGDDGMSEEQFRQYVLDWLRLQGQAEVAFLPASAFGGGVFPIKQHISMDDLFRAIPREEPLAILTLTGKDLTALIETSESAGPTSKPFSFVGVSSSNVNGRKIEEKLHYHLVTTQSIAMGEHPKLAKSAILRMSVLTRAGGYPLLLRQALVDHFRFHQFKGFRRDPKKTDLAGEQVIPHHGKLQDIEAKPTWTFNFSFQAGFTALSIEPININVVYTQHEEFNGGFYEKFNAQGQLQSSLKMETSQHLWVTELHINYALDTSIQWSKGPPAGPIDPRIYQESTDQVTLKTQYHWHFLKNVFKDTKWEVASPFIEALLETETTTTQRPDLSPQKFFENSGSTEIFHHFETRAKLGLSFQYDSKITMRLGGVWRKEWAPGLTLKDPVNIPARVNLDSSLGFSVDYEVEGWTFVKLGQVPLTLKSKAEYNMTFVIGQGKDGLNLHDFRWNNELRIGITSGLFLALGFRMIVFRGIFRPLNNNPEKKFIHGPVAFRFDPSLSFGFQWGARHQDR